MHNWCLKLFLSIYLIFALFTTIIADIPCPVESQPPIDLCLLMYTGNTLSETDFNQLKTFIVELSKNFYMSANDSFGVRMWLINFASEVKLEASDLYSTSEIQSVVYNMSQLGGNRNNGNSAMSYINNMTSFRCLRQHCKIVLMFITNTVFNDSASFLSTVNGRNEEQVEIISIGVSENVNRQEIIDISSQPQYENQSYWFFSTYLALSSKSKEIAYTLCSSDTSQVANIEPTSPLQTTTPRMIQLRGLPQLRPNNSSRSNGISNTTPRVIQLFGLPQLRPNNLSRSNGISNTTPRLFQLRGLPQLRPNNSSDSNGTSNSTKEGFRAIGETKPVKLSVASLAVYLILGIGLCCAVVVPALYLCYEYDTFEKFKKKEKEEKPTEELEMTLDEYLDKYSSIDIEEDVDDDTLDDTASLDSNASLDD